MVVAFSWLAKIFFGGEVLLIPSPPVPFFSFSGDQLALTNVTFFRPGSVQNGSVS